MNMRCYMLIALPMVLLIPVAAGAQNPEGFERDKVLAEWRSLAEKVTSWRNEFVREYYREKADGAANLLRKDFVRDSFNATGSAYYYNIDEFKGGKTTNDNLLRISNEKYLANLRKAEGSEAWVLTGTKPHSKEGKKYPLPWLVCGNVRLLIWIADDSFVISRREQIQAGVVKVHFITDQSKRKSPDAPEDIKSGFIAFDAEHAYCPVAYEYQSLGADWRGTDHGTMEYDFGAAHPILKAVVATSTIQHDKYGLTKETTKKSCKTEYNAHVSDEEFRLSFYGLPEPVGVEWPKPPRLWLWLTLAAAGSLILAAVFWKLNGRFQRPVVPPNPS